MSGPPPDSSPASSCRSPTDTRDTVPDLFASLLPATSLESTVRGWIDDDIPSFDVGGLVVGKNERVAKLWMKSPGVFAGRPFFDAIFRCVGGSGSRRGGESDFCVVDWEDVAVEGNMIHAGSDSNKVHLATVRGPANSILRAERTALNVLSRCSGVATSSRAAIQHVKSCGWDGLVAGTRKTTPGFRVVEKYGLLVGGAATHRLDLSQMVMLKDNHVWSCGGSIADAVRLARRAAGFSQKIEVECRCLEEALVAAEAGADIVMLDNFTPDQLKKDAALFKAKYPHVIVEASGGITTDTISNYLSEHVDVISQGKLTQGYDCIDFSLKIER